MNDSGRVLLDAEMNAPVVAEVREVVSALPGAPAIAELHVWRVGKRQYACILSLIAAETIQPDAVRKALSVHGELVHMTPEVNRGVAARSTSG